MEYIFLLFNYFSCQKGNFWLRQIKVLLVVLSLANIACANDDAYNDLLVKKTICRIMENRKRQENFAKKSCGSCGETNGKDMKEFVLNGSPVKPVYRYPWMVALTKYGKKLCGGAIINDQFILTAAHCISKIKDKPHMIKISFLSPTKKTTPGQPVEKIYPHPEYKDEVFAMYDIALIKLKNKISCDMYKRPVCLPAEKSPLPPATRLTIAGWGAVKGGKDPQFPQELLEGDVMTSKCLKCNKMYDSKKCTGGYVYCMEGVANQAACFGDSGGPMFLRKNGKYYIQGVTSGGDSECAPGSPFAFASVSSARTWIKKIAGI